MQFRQSIVRHQKMIAAMKAEYGDPLDDLPWITEARAREAETERAYMLSTLAPHLELDFEQTKPHVGPLSPGCRVCGDGRWSCLFINGKCNCRCFYCPTTQDEIGVPTTNQVPFTKPSDYADYIRYFDFSGVSISGGEPLLTFDRTARHIEAVRRKMGADLHIWLYTNTTLLTEACLLKLKDAGLNEIRMDISAVDYSLKKVAMAAGILACVTVEIPAIPEDHHRLAALLPVMQDLGVRHLNLHQLRLTPHNRVNLGNRPYTFLHGEKVTVLESELMALALIQEARDKNIGLPINYCTFVYKHRYQRAAARRRNARFITKDHEAITANGYIRTLAMTGDPKVTAAMAQKLEDCGADRRLWQITSAKDRLYFHPSLWAFVDNGGDMLLSYAVAGLCPHLSYHFYFKEIRVNPEKRLYLEKRPVLRETRLDADQRRWLGALLSQSDPPAPSISLAAGLQELAQFEFIEPGLQEYF